MARTESKLAPSGVITIPATSKVLISITAPTNQKVIVKRTQIIGKGTAAGATPVEITGFVGTLTGGTGGTYLTPQKCDPADSTTPQVAAKYGYSVDPTHSGSPVQVLRAAFPPTLGYLNTEEIKIPAGQTLLLSTNAAASVDVVVEVKVEE